MGREETGRKKRNSTEDNLGGVQKKLRNVMEKRRKVGS